MHPPAGTLSSTQEGGCWAPAVHFKVAVIIVLSDYNSIRQRLLNSETLLESTNLVLFSINETTLVRSYNLHLATCMFMHTLLYNIV